MRNLLYAKLRIYIISYNCYELYVISISVQI